MEEEGGRTGERKEKKDEREEEFFLPWVKVDEEKERKKGRRRNCTESFGPVVEVGRNPRNSQSARNQGTGTRSK